MWAKHLERCKSNDDNDEVKLNMEWLFPLIALGMVVLLLVAPIIALVRTRSLSEIVRTLENGQQTRCETRFAR